MQISFIKVSSHSVGKWKRYRIVRDHLVESKYKWDFEKYLVFISYFQDTLRLPADMINQMQAQNVDAEGVKNPHARPAQPYWKNAG